MADKVIGGDFIGYYIFNVSGEISLVKLFLDIIPIKTIKLNKANIDKVEIITEESKKRFMHSFGLGAVGGLLLGPLGLLAGVLAGGNKKEVCFACYMKDGKKFMAVADSKIYQKLASLVF